MKKWVAAQKRRQLKEQMISLLVWNCCFQIPLTLDVLHFLIVMMRQIL